MDKITESLLQQREILVKSLTEIDFSQSSFNDKKLAINMEIMSIDSKLDKIISMLENNTKQL